MRTWSCLLENSRSSSWRKVWKKKKLTKKKKENIICYKYNKRRYYRPDCPLLKKNLKKSKSNTMIAIWRDSDISSFNEKEEEGVANLCLMIDDNEVYLENSFELTFDELFKIFNDGTDEYKKIRLKNKELKMSNLFLIEEKNKIMIEKKIFWKIRKY